MYLKTPLVFVVEPGHRADQPLVRPLGPVVRRLVPQRRVVHRVGVRGLDRVALVVEQPHQPGVRDRHVVALEVVVDGDLPVRLLGVVGIVEMDAGLAERFHVAAEVALQQRPHPFELRRQRLRGQIEVDEDQPAEHLGARAEQRQLRLVQAGDGAVLGCADERSVEVVGPAVVRASQRLLLTRDLPPGGCPDGGRC